MTPLDLAKILLAKAQEDEEHLKQIVDNPMTSETIFGFHAQQAVEKYLKAVLAIAQVTPVRTHEVNELLAQVENAGYDVPERFAELPAWSPFAVAGRYEDVDTPSLDRQHALHLVIEVRQWAEELIRQASA